MNKFDFQKVAANYDDIHVHSQTVSADIGRYVAQQVGVGGRILEIGIGTGRIGAPVVANGCTVVGFDVSQGMLHGAAQRGLDQLLIADMMAMPFATASFDATLAVHVLHHASDWREVLRESVRVLREGGMFIEGRDWNDPASPAMRMRNKMREVIMALSPGIRPPGAGAAKQQFLARMGAEPLPEDTAASWQAYASPAQMLAQMQSRTDPETWAIEPTLLDATLATVEVWAREEWPNFDTVVPYERRFVINSYRIHHQIADAS
ncbi:MAG: class I SAM-dependent methyltransferase [Roseiflexaceae bacterium]